MFLKSFGFDEWDKFKAKDYFRSNIEDYFQFAVTATQPSHFPKERNLIFPRFPGISTKKK